jgi:hypothetical protein
VAEFITLCNNSTMNINEYAAQFPEYAIDFDQPLKDQPRIYDAVMLSGLPIELEPIAPRPTHKGRGLPNPNQTLTHHQCGACEKVLRNDYFHMPQSLKAENRIFTYCKACFVGINAEMYVGRAELIEARRTVIWHLLAPKCTLCGFDKHLSAMDLHHMEGAKEHDISALITRVTLAPTVRNAERLLAEAKKCIPLCANCHRQLHAGVLSAEGAKPFRYDLVSLMGALRELEGSSA